MSAPPLLVESIDVGISDSDFSFQHRIIAEHKLDERRLSAARGSDDCRYLSLGDVYRHVVQGLAQGVRVVLEHDVLDVDALGVVG